MIIYEILNFNTVLDGIKIVNLFIKLNVYYRMFERSVL